MINKLIKALVPKSIIRFRRKLITLGYVRRYRKNFPPLIIRKGTSDLEVFKQIFINKDYDLSYDIKPKFIIDGGANVGYSTLFFANKFPQAKVFAIEPEASNFDVLVKNTSANKNIVPIKKGLWYKKGHLKIDDSVYQGDKGWGKWGFITTEANDSKGSDVEVITINEIVAMMNNEDIDILKLDIEGAEKEIFSENYESWLGKVNVLIIELHDRLKPGCSDAVYAAINKYKFKKEVSGEYVVFKKIK